MDVVKYSAPEMGKEKILIPTTFGTGAEMTTYCVLKFDGKKKLLREDKFLADRAVVDSYFMDGTPQQIVSNCIVPFAILVLHENAFALWCHNLDRLQL